MKLSQNKIKWLARLMLGLVLFTQGVIAANACDLPSASPAQAYDVAQQDEDAMPCHEEETSNANVCLSHCTQSDQISVDQHQAPLAMSTAVVLHVVEPQPTQRILPATSFEQLALDTGPPIPIRFCSLLN